jgi:hypothetical protein
VGVLASIGATAAASDVQDASHGRIGSDIDILTSAGVTFAPRGPRAAFDLRVGYLWTAGVFATYEDGIGIGIGTGAGRALAFGVEMRPLFFAKWLRGVESGNRYVDLATDSLSLEVGPVFSLRDASASPKRGLQSMLGLRLPILPQPTTPVIAIHVGARWADNSDASSTETTFVVLLTLGWQQSLSTGATD